MFCPKCGKADQKPETYCRQCGAFLPDFDKKAKQKQTPEDHIKANSFLTLLTGIVSITLAILLYYFYLGKENTPPIIYMTAGFLTAIFAWQVQTFWRMQLLKKHFKNREIENAEASETEYQTGKLQNAPTAKLLDEADLSNAVPASVTENTTTKLGEKIKR